MRLCVGTPVRGCVGRYLTDYQLPLAYLLVGASFIVSSFTFVFYGLYREVRRSAVAFEVGEYRVSRLCFAAYGRLLAPFIVQLGGK